MMPPPVPPHLRGLLFASLVASASACLPSDYVVGIDETDGAPETMLEPSDGDSAAQTKEPDAGSALEGAVTQAPCVVDSEVCEAGD